jgi:hypothetical protein
MTINRTADMQIKEPALAKTTATRSRVSRLPAHRSCFGLPEDTLIIPPIMYPRPRDSPGNTPFVGQLAE